MVTEVLSLGTTGIKFFLSQNLGKSQLTASHLLFIHLHSFIWQTFYHSSGPPYAEWYWGHEDDSKTSKILMMNSQTDPDVRITKQGNQGKHKKTAWRCGFVLITGMGHLKWEQTDSHSGCKSRCRVWQRSFIRCESVCMTSLTYAGQQPQASWTFSQKRQPVSKEGHSTWTQRPGWMAWALPFTCKHGKLTIQNLSSLILTWR